jgi:hypothetical protein
LIFFLQISNRENLNFLIRTALVVELVNYQTFLNHLKYDRDSSKIIIRNKVKMGRGSEDTERYVPQLSKQISYFSGSGIMVSLN